jgi:hypothetical protein
MTDVATAVADVLRAGGWSRTPRLRLLDFDVVVHSDDPALVDLVEVLYAPAVVPPGVGSGAPHVLALGEAVVDGRPGFSVTLDGVGVTRTTAPGVAFAHLVFEANRQSIECSTAAVLLHAAAAVVDGVAVVLPGAMGAGKSTLVAGLVHSGAGYLTDEATAIDPTTGVVHAYPKPISLGALPPPPLPAAPWVPPAGARAYLGSSGLVPVEALRPGAVAAPTPAGLVVLPAYVPGAPTTVERLGPADALAAVGAHAFHLDRPGALPSLAGVLGPRPCYRLESGDLGQAVAVVRDLVAGRAG